VPVAASRVGEPLSFAGGECSGVEDASGVIGPVSEDVVVVAVSVPAATTGADEAAGAPVPSPWAGAPAAAENWPAP
jgi:hypothetical protein